LCVGGRPRDTNASFTTLEVLISTLIVSLLLSIGVPNLIQAYRRMKFEMLVQKVYAFCHKGYNYAITRRKMYPLYIEPEENVLVLERVDEKETDKLTLPAGYRLDTDIRLLELGYEGTIRIFDGRDPFKANLSPQGELKIIDAQNNWEAQVRFSMYWGGITLSKF
jgi:type II secretory pathway pseudopilin PulG